MNFRRLAISSTAILAIFALSFAPSVAAYSAPTSSQLGFITIYVSHGPYTVGKPILVIGQTLTSPNGTPVTGKFVWVWVNNVRHVTISMRDGVWWYVFTPTTNGNYTVSASSSYTGAGITSLQFLLPVSN